MKLNLLIIEDDAITAKLLSVYARQHGFSPIVSPDFVSAKSMDWKRFSALLLDIGLPDGDGMELLCRAQREHPTLPCFVLTAIDKAEPAVVALKAGAVDYFTKPFDQRQIFTSIQAVLRNPPSPRTAPPASPDPWKSEAMVAANRQALEAAATGVPVLLIGNPGTGKRAFANFIHRRSSRAAMPFITVDASALDEISLELELFGGESRHASGSFVRKRGKIEMCQGGTLYIHEIEHLPLSLQARLCEALELKGNDPRGTGFRLIASSRSDLGGQFRRNLMRHDLFYRLSTAPVHLPSLCEATEDIPTWCERLLTEICIHHQRRRPQFTKGALEALVDFPWPGNLDQLRQTLEQVLMQSTRKLIGIEDLPAEISAGGSPASMETTALPQAARINDLEQAALIAALNTFNGNRRRTAKRLGVSLRTVYNMIDRYGLKNLTSDGSSA
jgi:DNA-binding NtrC family response regulator